MIEAISYAVALVALGTLAWDGWRRYLVIRAKSLAVNEQIKALNTRCDVIHGDLVSLSEMSQKEFTRMAGKQSMQTMGAQMFQPQTGGKPF